MSQDHPPVAPSRPKRALFSLILVLLVLGVFEAAARVYVGWQIGPSVLFFGTRWSHEVVAMAPERSAVLRDVYQRGLRGYDDANHNVRQHQNARGGYSKYFPHQLRTTYDADTGEKYPVRINDRGFRGPDWSAEKPAGVVRVAALGASSTLGYNDPDDGTYPAILERELDAAGCASRYEVMNFGIPHLTSAEIVALFLAEAVPLAPDVVTFYEGLNDAASIEGEGGSHAAPPRPRSAFQSAGIWTRDHLVLGALADEIVKERMRRYTAGDVKEYLAGRPEGFVANLERLRQECAARGILLVVVKQQARSLLVPREMIHGVTYADEVAQVREKLAREGWVGQRERFFLAHAEILAAEERWAKAAGVPFVDAAAALDGDREVLVSWVHLSRRGNQMLAEAIAPEILRLTCPPGATTAAARGAPPPAAPPRRGPSG